MLEYAVLPIIDKFDILESMDSNNNTGKLGEDAAADYLLLKGYMIRERNWRYDRKEIDIIAREGDVLVIVEVKTRKEGAGRSAGSLVDKQKEKFLIQAADAYIRYNELDIDTRFDIVLVDLSGGNEKIRHIKNAFYPTMF